MSWQYRQQKEDDGKTSVCDKHNRAITYVLRCDLQCVLVYHKKIY